MPTIPDDILEFTKEKQKEKRSRSNLLAYAIVGANILPSSTRHFKAISNATGLDSKWFQSEPDYNVFTKEFNRKLAAAHIHFRSKGDIVLYSEKQFKELYERDHPGRKVFDGLEDPFDDKEKAQLHENFRREGATRRALTFIAQFMLGDRTKISMDVNEGYADPEEEDKKVAELNANETYRLILNQIATIDKNVGLFDRLEELIVTGHNYGRAVLVKQYDKDGIVTNLVPLFSLRLGKVYVDDVSHKLLGIEYKDYEGEERILKADDIIYYAVDDFPVTPGSRWFGLPPTETTMATATSNRITMEVAVGEIVKRMWAKARIIKAPSIKGQTKLDEFAKKIKPGKDIIINQADVTVETLDLDADIEKLLKSIEEREKKIFRDLTIPLVVGFQDEQNRATAQYALHQWTVSVLKHKRTKLRNVIEEQYYKPLLKKILEKRQKQIEEKQKERATELEALEQPTPATINMNPMMPQGEPSSTPITTNATSVSEIEASVSNLPKFRSEFPELAEEGQPQEIGTESFIDPVNPPFRIKMNFDNIIFDTFIEKAAAVLGFLEAGAITKEIALELAGVGQEFIEKMKAAEAEKEAMALAGDEDIDLTEVPDLDTTMPEDTGGPGGVGGGPTLPNLPIAAPRIGASSKILERDLQLAQIRRRQQFKRILIESINEALKQTLRKQKRKVKPKKKDNE